MSRRIGVSVQIIGEGDGQKIKIFSKRCTLQLSDKDGVLENLIARGAIGTKDSNFIHVSAGKGNQKVLIKYYGRDLSVVIYMVEIDSHYGCYMTK